MAADMLFDSLGITDEDVQCEPFTLKQAQSDSTCQVAIVCVAKGSHGITDALVSDFDLLPIDTSVDISLDHPTFRALFIKDADYPEAGLSEEGLPTLGTTAFLAARTDAPNSLVRAALEALYSNTEAIPEMITRAHAAEWKGLALHPEARRFYEGK